MMHPVNRLRTGRALFRKDEFKDGYQFDYDALGNFVQCVGELEAPDCVPAGSIKLIELDNFPYWIYCTVAERG